MAIERAWIMIPARGGSRGLPRKNVRLLDGIPLISHVIRAALQACESERVFVITDDDEIAAVAQAEGAQVTREPQTTGRATLDDVALRVLDVIEERGARPDDVFLTLQPTCPFIRSERISDAMAAFDAGAGSVISVVDDRHLGWRLDPSGKPAPDYRARVNRQQLDPQFRETGGVIGCRVKDLKSRKTRIVEPITLIKVDKEEAVDIDDFSDWAVAQYLASRRKILIRADAGEKLGMGHVFRALAVAQELAYHNVAIATDRASPLGTKFLSQYPFEIVEVDGDDGFVHLAEQRKPDLIILDQLDTATDYVRALKRTAGHVMSFEDQGPGASEVDLLISDLYENLEVPVERQLAGVSNAILAPNFETVSRPSDFRDAVENVLLVFGGTDPSRLTEKALQAMAAVNYPGEVTVIAGPGFQRTIELAPYGLRGQVHSNVKFMPGLMQAADLAVSSAGRTITELISLGVPVVCMCQNDKELTHTHASPRYGVVSLGLGTLAEIATIAAHIQRLIEAPDLRQVLRKRALFETAGRKNAAVIGRMLNKIGWTT